jgi:hypothetical protein
MQDRIQQKRVTKAAARLSPDDVNAELAEQEKQDDFAKKVVSMKRGIEAVLPGSQRLPCRAMDELTETIHESYWRRLFHRLSPITHSHSRLFYCRMRISSCGCGDA